MFSKREKSELSKSKPKVQLKYSGARDCGTRRQMTRHAVVIVFFLSTTMSSGATSLNRKRTHSLERGGERPGSDINAKKPRISPEAPSSRSGKKKRGKRRTVPVVEDIAGSARSHNDGAELMTPGVQHRGGHRQKPRRVVENDDEEDANIVIESTPHSQLAKKVCRGRARAVSWCSCFVVAN